VWLRGITSIRILDTWDWGADALACNCQQTQRRYKADESFLHNEVNKIGFVFQNERNGVLNSQKKETLSAATTRANLGIDH
jgi:hypothetical protein